MTIAVAESAAKAVARTGAGGDAGRPRNHDATPGHRVSEPQLAVELRLARIIHKFCQEKATGTPKLCY
jgi:hypothetical protein